MLDITRWTRADLQRLIDDQEPEGVHLDYKRSDVLLERRKDEITKHVCAFANSDGGVVVFGIRERRGQNGPDLPEAIDNGLGPQDISREALDQMLANNILPVIPNLRIREIDLGEGRRTFAVQVPPPGAAAPHQASDMKYYRRFNWTSQAMPDFDVRTMMMRKTTADLTAHAELAEVTPVDGKPHALGAKIVITIENESDEPCLYSVVELILTIEPDRPFGAAGFIDHGPTVVHAGQVQLSARRLTKNFAVPHVMPFFRGTRFEVAEFIVELDGLSERRLLSVLTKCPGQVKSTTFVIGRDGRQVTVEEVRAEQ